MKTKPHSSEPDFQKEDRFAVRARQARKAGVTVLVSIFAFSSLVFFLFWGWPKISHGVAKEGAPINQHGWGFYGKSAPMGQHNLVSGEFYNEFLNLNSITKIPEKKPEVEIGIEDRDEANSTSDPVEGISIIVPDSFSSGENGGGGEMIEKSWEYTLEEDEVWEYSWEEEEIWSYTGCPGPEWRCTLPIPEEPKTIPGEPKDGHITCIGFGMVEKEPQPINLDEVKKKIEYPDHLQNAGIKGKVTIRVLVGKEGNYLKHYVIKSAHPLLSKMVEKELPALRFTPAIRQSKAVRSYVTMPFEFTQTI